jgi:hypothetical protein
VPVRKAAEDEESAAERAEVLVKAGVVLRFNGMVYLRPHEVSELVYKVSTTADKATDTQPPVFLHHQHPRSWHCNRA